MYCVKCKKQTDTANEKITTTKDKRNMKRGNVLYVEQLKHSLSNHRKVARC